MGDGAPRLLLHVFATFAVGGPQVRFATLANCLGHRYRHIVVAMDGNYACAERLEPGLDVRCELVPVTKGATIGNVGRFRRQLRSFAPDLLVTYNWGSVEWAMANIPRLARHVHVEDGFGPEERTGQLRRRVLTRRIVLARSTIVLPSRNLWRIATEIWRLDPRRVHYVPNGIDLEQFAERRPASQMADGLVIGTVAALRQEKNLPRLLHAFRHVADVMPVRLEIVGDGPERAPLEQLAAELGIGARVRFAGYSDQTAALYRGFDIFALSSDTEQMPLSVIEAMASGLPVAATDVGDVRTMVAAENQDFITSLDPSALAKAIVVLGQDAALRRRVGAANRAKAEVDFGQQAMVAAYAALFDGVPLSAPA
jgi:glycosyltransferase involved in cell wall biosynthesis